MQQLNKMLIIIIGPTAIGKSKLAIDLAKKFSCEIINADSMQIYQGLNIATNKCSINELKDIKQHLISFVNPFTEIYHASDFQKDALSTIDNLHKNDILPIIVGGTNYYIESIIWDFLINTKYYTTPNENFTKHIQLLLIKYQCNEDSINNLIDPFNVLGNQFIYNIPTTELYSLLEKFDPQRAQMLHPNERRKIIRSLKIYEDTGVLASEFLIKQKENLFSKVSGHLKYPNSIIFWLDCENEKLKTKINKRVDDMIVHGLLDELKLFYKSLIVHPVGMKLFENNKGIFQNIGFKEFTSYFNNETHENLLSSIEKLKTTTLQYAKRQNKWIKSRFLSRRLSSEVPCIYKFDLSDITDINWSSQVLERAIDLVESHINGKPDLDKTINKSSNIPNDFLEDKHSTTNIFKCNSCEKQMIGQTSWESHLKSKNHKRLASS